MAVKVIDFSCRIRTVEYSDVELEGNDGYVEIAT